MRSYSENLIFCGVFIALQLITTFIQRRQIEFTKEINPELKGDALDVNFHKTWLKSCDEQQREQVYKAAYKTFSMNNILFPVLFTVLMIGQLFLQIGITPILVAGLIWLIQTLVYVITSLDVHKQ